MKKVVLILTVVLMLAGCASSGRVEKLESNIDNNLEVIVKQSNQTNSNLGRFLKGQRVVNEIVIRYMKEIDLETYNRIAEEVDTLIQEQIKEQSKPNLPDK